MKKIIFILNSILLTINFLLLIYFVVYTIIGSCPFNNFITNQDIQIQLVIALIFEFLFFIISKILSLIVKVDLSYKGTDVIKFVPKPILIIGIVIPLIITIYSIIVNINFEFIIMSIVMIFSIVLELGITHLFKKQS